MKKYKQAAASIAILTIMLSAGLYIGSNGDQSNSFGQRYLAQQEEILTAFENGDYSAWRNILAKNKKKIPNLSQADFQTFLRARQAARSGNYDQAIAISRQLKSKLQIDRFINS